MADLLKISKLKNTNAKSHFHNDQHNQPRAVQISVGSQTSRARDNQVADNLLTTHDTKWVKTIKMLN